MRRFWVAGAAAVIAVLGAGCASAAAHATSSSPAIRGSALGVYSCRAQASGTAVSVAPRQVYRFRICAQLDPGASGRTVNVKRGDHDFARLRSALSAPDQPRTTGVCPMYADVSQAILARTASGDLLVHIPVDGCGHYQSAALAAISAARADG
ncbi:MAG TPA: hypothetical protein VHB69_02465 [Mycobacteriales bacterium]|nr:hypothetical protein [Mycobacteriales bacterium]